MRKQPTKQNLKRVRFARETLRALTVSNEALKGVAGGTQPTSQCHPSWWCGTTQ